MPLRYLMFTRKYNGQIGLCLKNKLCFIGRHLVFIIIDKQFPADKYL